jgi:ribose 5-phosphate isomerase RpiB
MIYTARQLQDLFKTTGQVVLPYRARLTPLAVDWVKDRRITIAYSDTDVRVIPEAKTSQEPTVSITASSLPLLWWCDGPCGTAKAALMAQARETSLKEVSASSNTANLVEAIRELASEIKAGRAAGGVMMVQSGAAALVFANRCPSIRAIVGTCIETVEQGIQQVAANVLVVEYPHKTLQQIRNMLSRFIRGKRELSETIKRQLGELATCG